MGCFLNNIGNMGLFTKKLRIGRRKYNFKPKMAARFLFENEFGGQIDPTKTEDLVKFIYCILWACNDGDFPYQKKYDKFLEVIDKDPLIIVRAVEALGVDIEKKMMPKVKKEG